MNKHNAESTKIGHTFRKLFLKIGKLEWEHSHMTSDVFLCIFDLPTYPNQRVYYISLFSKIRRSLTYLPTQKSDVIFECSLIKKMSTVKVVQLRILINENQS